MTLTMIYVILFISLVSDSSLQQQFEVPEASVELLYPVGFTVSIPGNCCKTPSFSIFSVNLSPELCISSIAIVLYVNTRRIDRLKASCYSFQYISIRKDREGLRLFAFHGKLNEEFPGYTDGGHYSADITLARNNRWTYTDRTTRFKLGDIINYWLYVDYHDGRNQLGYRSEYRKFNVTECPRKIMNNMGVCNAADSSRYEFPNATVEVLQPRGFAISIPDQKGITLFAFHGKINEPFDGREAGYFASDITSSQNGKWTFTEQNTLLKPQDVLYYWLYVDYTDKTGRKIGYLKENQEYVVPDSGTCDKSLTTWNGGEVCANQLLLNEEFDSFNSNTWARDIAFANEPDNEFVIYEKFTENLNTKNGELHVKPTVADDKYGKGFIYTRNGYDVGPSCTADIQYDCKRKPIGGYPLPPVFSGRIRSNSFFKYGRVEIRAKLPKGNWIYPQLLLTPKQYEYGKNNYDSGEIRIAFVAGNSNLNSELQGKILLGTSDWARKYGISRTFTAPGEGWSDGFHTFSLQWNPDSLVFFVDNMEYGKIRPPGGGFSNVFIKDKLETATKWKWGSDTAPFDKEMRIKLGVGIGGHSFPDNVTSDKPYTNVEAKPHLKFYKAMSSWKSTWNEESELIVDYVKVYAL